MKRVYFATDDEESSRAKPRLVVFVEMGGGHAAASFQRKQLGESVPRATLLRGFERDLPPSSAGSTGAMLRVQAFSIAPASAPVAVTANSDTPPQSAAASAAEELPLFTRAFEPYRVRAWIDGRELREVVGQARREDARLAIALLLLIGISETIGGARLFPAGGPTRLLLTGPVFLLGALGAWRGWKWSVSLALVVALADTAIFLVRSAQQNVSGVFFLTIVTRLLLIFVLSRLRKSS